MVRRSLRSVVLGLALAISVSTAFLMISEAPAPALEPGGTFSDDNGNPHEGYIEAISAAGFTSGCSSDGSNYCPARAVTRAEMAAFLIRALGEQLPESVAGSFADVARSAWYAPYVDRLLQLGVVTGYEDGTFRPNAVVTRAEMAAMIVRSFDHIQLDDASRSFSDVGGDAWLAPYAEGLLNAGVTKGCSSSPLRFCPAEPVLRDQMAAFLARATGLDPIVPPPAPVGTGLVEIHVAVAASSASDANSGTVDNPLRTIQSAIDRSKEARKTGQGVRIVVHPGVYRESLSIGYTGSNPPPLVLEAAQPGTAIVSGSDVFTGWTYNGATGAYVHSWPHNWGQESGVAPIVGRREMVFVNGQRLDQVLNSADLALDTFYVNEASDQIHVKTSGTFLTAAEVAVRSRTIRIDGAGNATVRGLVFQHAASSFDDPSVEIVNGGGHSFENNVVSDNGWNGVEIATTSDLTFSRNVVNSNGGGGIIVFRVPRLLLDANTTSYNNWRGVRGDYTGWSVAAVKMVDEQDAIIRDHTSIGNHTRGFWVDYDVQNVEISGSRFSNNLTDGLFIEAAPGTVSVSSTEMNGNGRYGLLISNALAPSVTDSRMCGNAKSAIRIDSDPGGRTVDTASGSIWIPAARDLTLEGNTFGRSERLMDANVPSDHWSTFVDTLRSSGNTWVPNEAATAFVFQGQKKDLASWQQATGQDLTSLVATTGC